MLITLPEHCIHKIEPCSFMFLTQDECFSLPHGPEAVFLYDSIQGGTIHARFVNFLIFRYLSYRMFSVLVSSSDDYFS